MNNDVKGKWLWLGCSNEKNFRKEFETEEWKFELCTKASQFEENFAAPMKDTSF